jgi:hypothetical protein
LFKPTNVSTSTLYIPLRSINTPPPRDVSPYGRESSSTLATPEEQNPKPLSGGGKGKFRDSEDWHDYSKSGVAIAHNWQVKYSMQKTKETPPLVGIGYSLPQWRSSVTISPLFSYSNGSGLKRNHQVLLLLS